MEGRTVNTSDIKAALSTIHDEQLVSLDGVGWSGMFQEFDLTHPGWRNDIGPSLADDMLRRLCNEVIKGYNVGAQGVLDLPGIGTIPSTVTVHDGEGGYRRKLVTNATIDDILADVAIQEANAQAAIVSRDESQRLAESVIPIMEANGFDTAGPAIDLLSVEAVS